VVSARAERQAARRLSERIEHMLDITEERGADDLLDTVRQVARLNDLLGPPDPAFERRLAARIDARLAGRPPGRVRWRPRLAWAAIGVLLIVGVGLFTRPGQAVMANLMAIIRLGRTEVRVEPETTTVARPFVGTAEITIPGLREAQATVAPRILQTPAYLPPGYQLHRVSSSHFDRLPDWAQPLFIDVTYRHETTEFVWDLSFRQYFLAPGGEGTIQALTYPTEGFESVEQVTVGGQPAVLLIKQPASPVRPSERLRHLVWEGEGAVLTLTTTELSSADVIRVAESVAPYR
jgi:hypothetical protein